MTPHTLAFLQAFGPFLGALIVGALAFWLGRKSLQAELLHARNQIQLHEGWLKQSRDHCAAWEHRYDREKADRQNDTTQLAAVIETAKAREARLTQEYNEKIAAFRMRVEAAEKWVPKRGDRGLFAKKKQ